VPPWRNRTPELDIEHIPSGLAPIAGFERAAFDLARVALTAPGFRRRAEDGEKGCAMALSERPDIILMDLEMPVVDGWEASRRLKRDPQTRDIPIIVLSAHTLAGEREKALAAGCNEFDTKPIEFDRLVATVRRIVANRK
jgi:CheY-like chemotaxis protein